MFFFRVFLNTTPWKNNKDLNLFCLTEMLNDIYVYIYIPIQERLSLLLTIYPEGQEQVPPSGEA